MAVAIIIGIVLIGMVAIITGFVIYLSEKIA